jgi:aerobic C4-dicarboxylate transport protein
LIFRILIMIMWLAPMGAFGGIAAVVGATGVQAIISLFTLMAAFYLTCIIFIVVILGGLFNVVIGVNIFKLMRYLGREFLIIFSTSSSEAALPRLIAKMEHLGVPKPVVGVTVPTGYSFNLDGTALYLTMASLFISTALGKPLSLGEQIGLLVFMIVASKGCCRRTWTKEIDRGQVDRVLDGHEPFDEATMLAHHSFDRPAEGPGQSVAIGA